MRRATVFQNMQIAPEVTPGTPVAATAKLIETYINPKPAPSINVHRPAGSRWGMVAHRGKEYTTADIEAALSYTEIGYFLASLLSNTTPGTYVPPAFAAPAVNTLTVECGSTGRAERFAYGVVDSLRFRFTKEEAALTGSMFGRTLSEGFTLTAGLTHVTKAPVNPDKVQVKIGDSIAGLADVDVFTEAELDISGAFKPFFALDADQSSFSDITPLAPEMSAQLIIPHEATAVGYLTDLRACTTKFCRILAAETIGAVAYSFQITFPFAFTEPDRGDNDDVYASTFKLAPIYDQTYGKALEIVVVTS